MWKKYVAGLNFKWLPNTIAFIVLLAILFLLEISGILHPLEYRTLDYRVNYWNRNSVPDTNIVCIDIDENSLNFFEEQAIPWPWPREFYAVLLDYFTLAGTKAVVFDIDLSSADIDRIESEAEESEIRFAEAIKNNGGVYLIAILKEDSLTSMNPLDHTNNLNHEFCSELKFTSAIAPRPRLQENSSGVGCVNLIPDSDGQIRRTPLIFKFSGKMIPQISFLLYLKLFLNSGEGADNFPSSLPFDNSRNFLLKYYNYENGESPFEHYSISSAILSGIKIKDGQEPILPLEKFRDKIIFIGATATSLNDIKTAPIAEYNLIPGMELHTTLLSNLIQKDFIKLLPDISKLYLSTILILIVLLSFTFFEKTRYLLLVSIGVYVLFILVALLGFYIYDYLFPIILPSTGMLLAFVYMSVYKFVSEGKQKLELRRTFSRYISKEVVDEILLQRDEIKLGGRKVIATVFFSDIVSFTSFAENLEAEELVRHLNNYFSQASDIILKHKAMLDKYIGDAIMAVFGAPVSTETHAVEACAAALEIKRQMNHKFGGENNSNVSPFITRMGLNTGEMIVGNIGSRLRVDYTAIGDPVNIASRLESMNKIFGTDIIIGQETLKASQNKFEVRELDLIAVKGKKIPLKIYELISEKGLLSHEEEDHKNNFEEGLIHYRNRNWNNALMCFDKAKKIKSNDLSIEIYRKRIINFMDDEPAPDWNGVYYSNVK
ncbi:MAG: adenylate/guanylate cyclase domain-containing protein [Bacteroidetes bacterium]|nr:adenylate/guanylate cyclase domain-containing protein [Bacteroidota bacterium]